MLKFDTKTLRPEKGINEDVDELKLAPPFASEIVDLMHDKNGSLTRRPGIASASATPSGELSADVPKTIGMVGDSTIVVGNRRVYVYDRSTENFRNVGPAPPGSIHTEDFITSEWSHGRSDVAYVTSGSDVYRAQVTHVYANIYDDGSFENEHRVYLQIDQIADSTGRLDGPPGALTLLDSSTLAEGEDWPYAPKVMSNNNQFIVGWATDLSGAASSVRLAVYDTDGTEATSETIVTTNAKNTHSDASCCPFDMVPIGSAQVAVGWCAYDDSNVDIAFFDMDDLNAADGWSQTTINNTAGPFDFMSLAFDSSDDETLYVMTCDDKSGTSTQVDWYDYTVNSAGVTLNTAGNDTIFSSDEIATGIGMADRLDGGSYLPIVIHFTSSTVTEDGCLVALVSLSTMDVHTVNSASSWEVFNAYPTHAPFANDTQFFWPGVADGDVGWTVPSLWQSSIYDQMEPYLSGVWDFGLGEPISGGYASYESNPDRLGSLSHVAKAGDLFSWDTFNVGNYNEQRGEWTRSNSLVTLDVSFRPQIIPSVRNCAIITGSIPLWFDGTSVMEMGVYASPNLVEGSSDTNSSEDVSYVGIFEFKDSAGVSHRGVPSPSLEFPAKAGSYSMYIDVESHPATRSRVHDDFKRLNLDLYASGSTSPRDAFYRRVNSPEEVYLNNFTAALCFTYRDTDGDVDNIIYNASGADLEAEPLSSCKHMTVVADRVWAGGFARKDRVQYSDPFSVKVATADQYVPEFNQLLGFQMPNNTDVTGIAEDGDRGLVFTNEGVYSFQGDGPDLSGASNDFSKSVSISDDYGCVNPKSVVSFAKGTFFQSEAGLCAVSRNKVEKVSNVDESLKSLTILDSFVVSKRSHVVFVCSEDSVTDTIASVLLVYDYDQDAWYKWNVYGERDGPLVVAGCADTTNGELILIDSSWNLFTEQTDFADYDDAPVSGYWTTPWLHFGTDNALGKFTALTVNITDVNSTDSVLVTNEIRAGTAAAPPTAGSATWTYSELASATQDTNPDRAQLKMHNTNTWCNSFRTRVTLTHAGGTASAACSLSSVQFEFAGALKNDPNENATRGT